MGTMSWDEDLEYLASLNVKGCIDKYDECIAIPKYPFAGQLIGMHWYTVRNVPLEDMLSQELEYWFEEYTYTKFHDLIEVPEEYSENHVGRFSLMIYENANRIGCSAGISQFTFGIFVYFRFKLTCCYSYELFVGSKVYNFGYAIASDCATGYNTDYPNLCSENELYFYDQ